MFIKNILIVCLCTVQMFHEIKSFSLQNCFDKDSISCIQLKVYQIAKSAFGLSTRGISDFLDPSRSPENPDGKPDEKQNQAIIHAENVEQRQILLERYFREKLLNLWNKVSVSWKNGILPQALELLTGKVTENIARSEKTKDNQLPLHVLIGAALKLLMIAALSYMTVASVASKALLAGSVAFLISGYVLIKNKFDFKSKSGMQNNWEVQSHANVNNEHYSRWLRSSR